jgi:glucose/arabinose dehydrogenase
MWRPAGWGRGHAHRADRRRGRAAQPGPAYPQRPGQPRRHHHPRRPGHWGRAAQQPLASSPDPNARRIIAHGLRNPFRFTPRPGTTELWLGDVGWSDWEEINRITDPLGTVENFGWPCYEGPGAKGTTTS